MLLDPGLPYAGCVDMALLAPCFRLPQPPVPLLEGETVTAMRKTTAKR